MARLKEFMSDEGHRGRIVFMVLTNRPDRLDADLKRPGRLDLKIPMFYPGTRRRTRGGIAGGGQQVRLLRAQGAPGPDGRRELEATPRPTWKGCW